jgi:lipopolysaccharide biosynthesis protein
MHIPFVIYADFECYARKIDTCHHNPDESSTTDTTKFEACGYSYVVVSSNDKYSKPAVVYRGDDAVKHFFEDVMEEEEYIKEKLSEIEPMIMN